MINNYLYEPKNLEKEKLGIVPVFFGVVGKIQEVKDCIANLMYEIHWASTKEDRKKYPMEVIKGTDKKEHPSEIYIALDDEGNVCGTILVQMVDTDPGDVEAMCYYSPFTVCPYGYTNTYN